MKIVGVTGGIAAGKSTVVRLFGARGAVVRSADEDARAILQPGTPALAQVLQEFPNCRLADGSLDRATLAARIFPDPAARHRLETITHPAIIARMRDAVNAARAQSGHGVLVYETPLLYEAGLEPLFDMVIAVVAPPELQAERLQARQAAAGRPALTQAAVAARLTAQLSPDEKARRADYVIRTDGTMQETADRVGVIWTALQS